jgi:flavodoxin I
MVALIVHDNEHVMKILILYGSLTGNTLTTSEHLARHFLNSHSVELRDQSEDVDECMRSVDLICIAASTWGEGEANPTTSFFIDHLTTCDRITQSPIALLGLGDSVYEHFCGVVDQLTEILTKKQYNLIGKPYKIDGYPDEEKLQNCALWLTSIIKAREASLQ